jgi:hypothetical protein
MPFTSVLGASSVIKPGVCTSSTRPTAPYVGQLVFETDTNRLVAFTASGWVYQTATGAPGLVHITSGSFTSATTVSLPANTFSSTYRNYRVIFVITSASTDVSVTGRFRASGSDDTNANYNTGYIGRANTGETNTQNGTNQTSAHLGLGVASGGVNEAHAIIDFIGPQLADKSLFSVQASLQLTAIGGITFFSGGGVMNTATQFDAFSFISTGNITGYYRVYGYADS